MSDGTDQISCERCGDTGLVRVHSHEDYGVSFESEACEHCPAGLEHLDPLERAERAEAEVERLRDKLKQLHDADVMIVLYKKGTAGGTFFKGIEGRIPSNVEVSYGESDDPPQTIRRVVIKAGWTQAQWRKMDRSALHEGGA